MSLNLFSVPVPAAAVDVAPGPSSSVLGRVAELRAEARLLELGHEVARPSVDDGVDLVVDCRFRVQVKSTGGLQSDFDAGRPGRARWRFDFGREVRLMSGVVDVVVLYARDVDAWWVVPASEFEGRVSCVRVRPGGRLDREFRGAWQVFRELAS